MPDAKSTWRACLLLSVLLCTSLTTYAQSLTASPDERWRLIKPGQRVTLTPPDSTVVAPYADLLDAAAKRVTQDRSLDYAVEILKGMNLENNRLREAVKYARMSARDWEDLADQRGAMYTECMAQQRGLKVWAGIGKGVVVTVGVGLLAVAVHQYMER